MKRSLSPNPTSVIVRVFLLDSSKTDGSGLTGLTNASSGLSISIIKDGGSGATTFTSALSHIETIATLGTWVDPSGACCRFKEVDATNLPGVYELQFKNSDLSGCAGIVGVVKGATNLAPCPFEIDFTNYMTAGIFLGSVTGATTTTTLIDSKLSEAATDFWKGSIVVYISGALKRQKSAITAFDPATDKITFDAMTGAGSSGDDYLII